MARDGADTQTRILDAARTEFAAFGLAGARIDRIAKAASASKERMYAYFPDKKALFLAVLDLNLREFSSAVVLVNDDLPAFAGALFDHTVSHPQHLRMLDWARLETDGTLTASLDIVVGFRDDQVRRIRSAQDVGAVDPAWDPMLLMTLIFGIISAWVHEPGSEASPRALAAEIAERRANVVRAVERLIDPQGRRP